MPIHSSAASIEIRQATAIDARAIAEIHVVSWQAAYAGIMPAQFLAGLSIEKRVLAWRNALAAGRVQVALASVDKELAGWTAYGQCRDADKDAIWGEIEAIYLHPSRYGQGIGTSLIEHACCSLREMGYTQASLWVLTNNWRARTFYERTGFVTDEQLKTVEIGGSLLHEIRYRRGLAK
ncbi:GNAT family N-acetyltransferase [Trinickia fusca]|uniref:GNAT family N-acetyltransferase n=1 Tax=Trinickia fusca TaxID=2419777 RepID=A0A494XFL9_9BURK|nr:GNAT family N-acetyltransferase [Trinickia fusca]RKP46949.1 GNAT family N-acetyltransferase [Trinickia fusca]